MQDYVVITPDGSKLRVLTETAHDASNWARTEFKGPVMVRPYVENEKVDLTCEL